MRYLFSVSQKTMLGREGHPVQRIRELGRDGGMLDQGDGGNLSTHAQGYQTRIGPMKAGLTAFAIL